MNDSGKNRAQRRFEAAKARRYNPAKRTLEVTLMDQKEERMESIERKAEEARRRKEERDNFRKKVATKLGVNFKRVILTSKLYRGEATYHVK